MPPLQPAQVSEDDAMAIPRLMPLFATLAPSEHPLTHIRNEGAADDYCDYNDDDGDNGCDNDDDSGTVMAGDVNGNDLADDDLRPPALPTLNQTPSVAMPNAPMLPTEDYGIDDHMCVCVRAELKAYWKAGGTSADGDDAADDWWPADINSMAYEEIVDRLLNRRMHTAGSLARQTELTRRVQLWAENVSISIYVSAIARSRTRSTSAQIDRQIREQDKRRDYKSSTYCTDIIEWLVQRRRDNDGADLPQAFADFVRERQLPCWEVRLLVQCILQGGAVIS